MASSETRLRRLGIDPDGDPLEILRELRRIQQELDDQLDEPADEDEDGPAMADDPKKPR